MAIVYTSTSSFTAYNRAYVHVPAIFEAGLKTCLGHHFFTKCDIIVGRTEIPSFFIKALNVFDQKVQSVYAFNFVSSPYVWL